MGYSVPDGDLNLYTGINDPERVQALVTSMVNELQGTGEEPEQLAGLLEAQLPDRNRRELPRKAIVPRPGAGG